MQQAEAEAEAEAAKEAASRRRRSLSCCLAQRRRVPPRGSGTAGLWAGRPRAELRRSGRSLRGRRLLQPRCREERRRARRDLSLRRLGGSRVRRPCTRAGGLRLHQASRPRGRRRAQAARAAARAAAGTEWRRRASALFRLLISRRQCRQPRAAGWVPHRVRCWGGGSGGRGLGARAGRRPRVAAPLRRLGRLARKLPRGTIVTEWLLRVVAGHGGSPKSPRRSVPRARAAARAAGAARGVTRGLVRPCSRRMSRSGRRRRREARTRRRRGRARAVAERTRAASGRRLRQRLPVSASASSASSTTAALQAVKLPTARRQREAPRRRPWRRGRLRGRCGPSVACEGWWRGRRAAATTMRAASRPTAARR